MSAYESEKQFSVNSSQRFGGAVSGGGGKIVSSSSLSRGGDDTHSHHTRNSSQPNNNKSTAATVLTKPRAKKLYDSEQRLSNTVTAESKDLFMIDATTRDEDTKKN